MIRFFDIIFSSIGLLAFSPIILFVSIILKLTGEGEILYFQKRVGKNNKIFWLIKFATMKKDSEHLGTKSLTIKDDPRILPFGSYLRKSKINEILQLVNVFKGDMSLIGPRPLTEESFNIYSDQIKVEISELKPGLSGVGSIIFRNEEDLLANMSDPRKFYKEIIAPYKGNLEIWYKNNFSLKIYFYLIILTVLAVILPNLRIFTFLQSLPQPPIDIKEKVNF